MPPPKKPEPDNKGKKKRKSKQPTQRPAFRWVMVMGPTGKTTMRAEPW